MFDVDMDHPAYDCVQEVDITNVDFNKKTNLSRGLTNVDIALGKPEDSELILFAWYAGIGKTEYSYFFARQNARMGNKTSIISLELPIDIMIKRHVLKKFWYNKYQSQTEEFPKEEEHKMYDMMNDLHKIENLRYKSTKWWCDINQLESIIREEYRNKHKLIIIDNLGKILGDTNENVRFDNITSRLQDLKNELGICIILVHHLKKPSDNKKQYEPWGISWFRGSQKIIDNATQVIEIRRDKDPNVTSPIDRAEVMLIQYKDTIGGNMWSSTFYFYDGEYHETYQR